MTVVVTPTNARKFAGLNIDEGVEQTTGLCVGIYGPGGCGKTTTLARIVESPRIKKALLVDAEGGSTSVKHLVPKGLDIVHVNKWSDLKVIRNELKSPGHGYDAVIWDHLTEIANMYIMSVAPDGIPQIQQWNQILINCMELVREQRRLTVNQGLHVGFIAWEEHAIDKELEMITSRVCFSGKFQAAFPGMVTMLGRQTVVSDKPPYLRKLTFVPSERTDSKFRVAPTDAAASIPQELYLRMDDNTNFIVDFMNAVCYGESFDASKYVKKEGK